LEPMTMSIVGGALQSGLSILSANARNAAIKRQAVENQRATQTILGQRRDITIANLYDKAQELGAQVGAELTNLGFEERKAGAKVAAQTIESNIYGMTAMKLQNQVEMDAAMMEDSIVQKGEAAMKDIQIGLSNAKYEYESGSYQNSMNYASAVNQMQSSSEIITGAIGAGISGAQSGYNLSKAFA
jgi:hypothetical protein